MSLCTTCNEVRQRPVLSKLTATVMAVITAMNCDSTFIGPDPQHSTTVTDAARRPTI